MSRVYYNDYDPGAASWLRQLVRGAQIPDGDVDERSIKDLKGGDLAGYDTCHFFCGIGGWPLALELAGWPKERPVWSGSCPCQPYSSAGRGLGQSDPRDLWPDFYRLIIECRPRFVFGEQVATAIDKGWLDRVSSDLEREGYAVAPVVLGAHSLGAPHQRQRLYWVAYSSIDREGLEFRPPVSAQAIGGEKAVHLRGSGATRIPDRIEAALAAATALGDAHDARQRPERAISVPDRSEPGGSPVATFWDDSEPLLCRDGKYRRVPTEPALFPLAPRLPEHVGLLRGAGNSICIPTAVEFIKAFMELEVS